MPTHRWMTQRSCYALAGKQFRAGGHYDVTGVYVGPMIRAAILSETTVPKTGSGDITQHTGNSGNSRSSKSPTGQQEALFTGPIGES
jgi:hypothetical protein